MKKLLLFIAVVCFAANYTFAQICTPDPACVDTGETGEVCPPQLPDGEVGQPYYHVETIIPPSTYDTIGATFTIHHIVVNAIDSLPPGITWQADNTTMTPPNKYCILFSGTPTTAGTYQLFIKVTPYIIMFGSVVQGLPIIDTSQYITIHPAQGISDFSYDEGMFLSPNPVNSIVKITYNTENSEEVKFIIYDLLGQKIEEKMFSVASGENTLIYDVGNLTQGTYICSLITNKNIFISRVVKN